MVLWAVLSVSFDLSNTKRLLTFFGCGSDYFSPKTDSRFINWNALSAALISLLLPLFVLALCEAPWRYFPPDGPLQGPIPVSALADGEYRGVIEFSDGFALHDYGWGIEALYSRYNNLTYADPFVTEQWDPTKPVRVWVIHRQYEDLTAQHRFGYVVSWNYAQRNFWNKIIAGAMNEHALKAPEDLIVVTLDTRGPRFEQGPTLLQFIFGLYFFLGLYLGFAAYALRPPGRA